MSKSEYLPPEVWAEVAQVMQPANLNAVRVSLETGMRIEDVLSLRPEQLKGSKLTYVAKKTGKEGTAKLSAELRRELKKQASGEWVFPSRRSGKHRTRQAVYKDIKKACALLGVVGQISPHSARKTFAVELRKKSGVAEVQRALQHADSETTMLYAFADCALRSKSANSEIEFAELVADVVVRRLKQMFE